jgi:hypothetical protein
VQSIRRIDVYRVAEKPNAPPITEEEFSARATVVGSVPYSEIIKGGDNLTYTDTLELAGVPARLRYAVRFVNSAGQSAAFSNFLLVEPAARVAEPPANVSRDLSETAVTINWDAPKTNIDGSTPVNLLGYNVYRTIAAQPEVTQKPLNQELIANTKYQDRSFKFGQRYTYVVRTVSLGTEGKPVESLNSDNVEAAPVDIYPPSAPGQISPAASPGRISLFWPANPEPDVAGYTIYRSTDPNLPKDRWTKLTPALYTRTTFTDENVEAGKTYYYYIAATDTSGNVSRASEVVSETVP